MLGNGFLKRPTNRQCESVETITCISTRDNDCHTLSSEKAWECLQAQK